jgi:hypothetical protein
VTLVEKHKHGRRLPEHRLRAVEGADPLGQAAVADRARSEFGIANGSAEFDFAEVMERVQR